MKTGNWTKELELLNEALQHAGVELSRHEQTLASPLLTSDLSGERHMSWQRALERFSERLNDCRGQVELAERKTRQAELALAEVEVVVRAYQSRSEEIRAKLALPK